MPMLDLIALYLDLTGADFRGQIIKYGYLPGPDRDRLIAAIRAMETCLNGILKLLPGPRR